MFHFKSIHIKIGVLLPSGGVPVLLCVQDRRSSLQEVTEVSLYCMYWCLAQDGKRLIPCVDLHILLRANAPAKEFNNIILN